MIVKMIQCDNPRCGNTGRYESDDPGVRTKKLLPPYGWLFVDGGWMGCGPYFKNVMVCELDCLALALTHIAEVDR